MSDYSDDEETEESASLLPTKERPHSRLTTRATSPFVNYVSVPVTPRQTPTNQVLSNGYEQIGNDDTDTSSIPSTESSAGFSFFALPRKQKAILASLPYVGIKFMYLSGLFLSGGCTLLFGEPMKNQRLYSANSIQFSSVTGVTGTLKNGFCILEAVKVYISVKCIHKQCS
uniref:Uncharacterized protein n=1 Tax=Magallana gigas TaxID=29159 RepID=K1QAB7_MAGGI